MDTRVHRNTSVVIEIKTLAANESILIAECNIIIYLYVSHM